MTHFLGRLVERARGTASRVEPIVAQRFAAVPVAEVASGFVPPTDLEIATAVETSPPVRRELRAREAAPDGTNETFVTREEPWTERPKEELIERAMAAQPETLLVPVPRPDDDVAQPPAETRGSESLRRDVLPHVQSVAAMSVVRRANHQSRSTIARPSNRSGVSANPVPFPNESAANEPPIVRVTIGRIEVHASSAPAAPARKRPARSEPKLSLDAYLKSRKEGAR